MYGIDDSDENKNGGVAWGWARSSLRDSIAALLLGFRGSSSDSDEDCIDASIVPIWNRDALSDAESNVGNETRNPEDALSPQFRAFLAAEVEGSGAGGGMRRVYSIPSQEFVATMRRGLLRAYCRYTVIRNTR